MKPLFPLTPLFMLLLFSCGQPASSESNSTPKNQVIQIDDASYQKDTIKINYIDSLTLSINKAMFHKPKLVHLDASQYKQENLKIGYYFNPETEITRTLISENETRVMNLKYIFYKDEKPFFMHYRYWNKISTPPFVEETYIYFDEEGKIFYAGERSAELTDGQLPVVLKDIDLQNPVKTKKELYDFAIKYWEMSKPLIDEHKASNTTN